MTLDAIDDVRHGLPGIAGFGHHQYVALSRRNCPPLWLRVDSSDVPAPELDGSGDRGLIALMKLGLTFHPVEAVDMGATTVLCLVVNQKSFTRNLDLMTLSRKDVKRLWRWSATIAGPLRNSRDAIDHSFA